MSQLEWFCDVVFSILMLALLLAALALLFSHTHFTNRHFLQSNFFFELILQPRLISYLLQDSVDLEILFFLGHLLYFSLEVDPLFIVEIQLIIVVIQLLFEWLFFFVLFEHTADSQ